jgi:hypothetical protein
MKQYCLLFLTAGSLFCQTTGTTLPTNCIAGQIFTKTNAPAGQNLYVALTTGQPCPGWTVQGGSGGVGAANAVQATNGSGAFVDSGCTATAGQITCPSGFVSTSSSPTLITMNYGTPPATPAAGKVAVYADSTNTGLSAKDPAGVVTRTIKPTDCTSTGAVQKLNPDGTVGCVAVGGAGGYSTVQDEGTPLTQRGTINFIGAGVSCADNAGGTKTDCTITGGGPGGGTAGTVYTQSFTSQTSVALTHNMALTPATAFTAQCFDGSGNLIVPANIIATSSNTVTATFGSAQTGSCTINAGGGSHFYSATMASGTTWTVAGTTHLLGTCDLDVLAWDAATGMRHKVTPADIACDDTAGAFTVTVTFGAAQAGRLVLIAAK